MKSKEPSKWSLMRIELNDRFNKPSRHPEFILYFLFVIFIIGISGIGMTVFIENKMTHEICGHQFSHIHIVLSIASYFIALLAASSVDLILSKQKSSDVLSKALIMFGVSALIAGIVLMVLSLLTEEYPFVSYALALLGVILSWYIWWITNSENPNLVSEASPENATPMPNQIVGNISNFKL